MLCWQFPLQPYFRSSFSSVSTCAPIVESCLSSSFPPLAFDSISVFPFTAALKGELYVFSQVTSTPWLDTRTHGSSFLFALLQSVPLFPVLHSHHTCPKCLLEHAPVILLLGYKAFRGPLVTQSRGQSPCPPELTFNSSSLWSLGILTTLTPGCFALAVLAWSAPLLHICVVPQPHGQGICLFGCVSTHPAGLGECLVLHTHWWNE